VGAASGLPVGLHAQGSGGAALAAALEAARGGADRIACAIYPVALALHRVSGEAAEQALAGLDLDAGVDVDKLWEACELLDDALGEEPVPPLSPRVAVRSAEHRLPAGLVAELDANLRRQGFDDRLDEVLEELTAIRGETGWPPLASPIGQILGSQALIHVLSAQRWQYVVDELRDLVNGRYGVTPGPVDPAVRRTVALVPADTEEDVTPALDELREDAEGIAASEEELLLLALFGEEAEPLIRAIRSRGRRDDAAAGLGRDETGRLRDLIRVVQESGIGEITIEEGDSRYTVRRAGEPAPVSPTAVPVAAGGVAPEDTAVTQAPAPPNDDVIRVEAPMVGTFYRAPSPGAAPFVEVGDAVEAGQTLCILEAMKLMNEIKAEGEALVRRVCVENESAVEYGDLLFELEPLNGRPLDAL
jgi:oxaloacetate decarboxylase alpha subunit